MKTTQILFAATVMLSGTVAIAQDSGDPTTDPMMDDTVPMTSPSTTTAPADTAPVDVDINPPAAAPAPTVLAPIVIQSQDDRAAKASAGNLFGFGRRPGMGGAIAEVKVGVGGGDYTENNVQNRTSGATTLDVRGVFGAHSPIGLEAAYVGSSRNVDNPPGATGDTQLVSNGVEGDVRLAIPIPAGSFVDIRPFAFGGVGYQYASLWGDGSVDGSRDDGDSILVIPAGVGIDLGVGPLNLEARGTYRHAIGSDLFGNAGAGFNEPNALHSYNIGGAIGLEF